MVTANILLGQCAARTSALRTERHELQAIGLAESSFLSLLLSHKGVFPLPTFLSLRRVGVQRRDPSIASTTVCNDELTRASSVKSTANDAVQCTALRLECQAKAKAARKVDR
jgi:hypothetical protein